MIASIESLALAGAVLISLLALAVAVAMIFVALAFSMHRGSQFKDCLVEMWNERRREVLHLNTQNGFYFFMMRLMAVSKRFLWLSAGVGAVVSFVYRQALPSIAFVTSLGMALWAVILWFIARYRINRFTEMLGCDGYGSIGKARTEWCSREREARSFFIGAVAVLLAAGFILLSGK